MKVKVIFIFGCADNLRRSCNLTDRVFLFCCCCALSDCMENSTNVNDLLAAPFYRLFRSGFSRFVHFLIKLHTHDLLNLNDAKSNSAIWWICSFKLVMAISNQGNESDSKNPISRFSTKNRFFSQQSLEKMWSQIAIAQLKITVEIRVSKL